MFARIAILAPGLLGASIAMALKGRHHPSHVKIWARREETRRELAPFSWCDSVADTPEACVHDADLTILCPPVDIIPPLLEQIAPHLKPGSLVTDVGSVKASICEAGKQLSRYDALFIGSHPMAGSEKNGHQHASAELFEGRPCILTPLQNTPAAPLQQLSDFWELLGMRPLHLSPETHDEQIAWVSHLPHLLASALSRQLLQTAPDAAHYSGPGLRDTTRIAAGDPALWAAIFESNQEKVSDTLHHWIQELEDWQKILQHRDWPRLRQYLAEAKQFRETLS